MKKHFIRGIVFVQLLLLLSGCFAPPQPQEEAPVKGTSLSVVTSFGPDAGNHQAYKQAVESWQQASGNTAENTYFIVDEISRRRILTDFETGSEADVLYFFAGSDATPFIQPGMVVPLEEIKQEYPNYGYNMDEKKLPASLYNGEKYVLPVVGYWQGMYVNKRVLEQAGVSLPNENTTWAEFLQMCQQIKQAGFVPIAMSLQNCPHYWFEYLLRNNYSGGDFALPQSPQDQNYGSWLAALADIKGLYASGYLPQNTFTATNQEVLQQLVQGNAAFAMDGGWKMAEIAAADENEDITVCYVPNKNQAGGKSVVGGISMGYYITRKAWENPEKRQAAVDFVMAMTSDEVVAQMSDGTIGTALKNASLLTVENKALQMAALNMVLGAQAVLPAIQYAMAQNVRENFMTKNIGQMVLQEITPQEVLDKLMEDVYSSGVFAKQ